MDKHTTLHIVDSSSQSHAQKSRLGFTMGHHCEIYSTITELVEALPTEGIVVVRDEGSGASANMMRDLSDRGIWLPVVVTSEDPRPRRVVEAIRGGALDYLRLPLREDRLEKAIVRILQEAQAYIQTRRKMAEARNRIAGLSPREREVLDWLTAGRSNKMIAHELSISPRTVEIHRANMMSKLGAHHPAEAVRLCIEANRDAARQASAA
jgi:FixJ family two-component response regulator